MVACLFSACQEVVSCPPHSSNLSDNILMLCLCWSTPRQRQTETDTKRKGGRTLQRDSWECDSEWNFLDWGETVHRRNTGLKRKKNPLPSPIFFYCFSFSHFCCIFVWYPFPFDIQELMMQLLLVFGRADPAALSQNRTPDSKPWVKACNTVEVDFTVVEHNRKI